MTPVDEELRCVCSSADGVVRCTREMTRDTDRLCDMCRAAKESTNR